MVREVRFVLHEVVDMPMVGCLDRHRCLGAHSQMREYNIYAIGETELGHGLCKLLVTVVLPGVVCYMPEGVVALYTHGKSSYVVTSSMRFNSGIDRHCIILIFASLSGALNVRHSRPMSCVQASRSDVLTTLAGRRGQSCLKKVNAEMITRQDRMTRPGRPSLVLKIAWYRLHRADLGCRLSILHRTRSRERLSSEAWSARRACQWFVGRREDQ